MVALPFFQPDETPDDYEPPPDYDPAEAPAFDYDAPHYVLRHEGNVPQDKRLTLAPMTLSRGAQPNGMLPGKEPTLDPATAGDAWATHEISEGGVPTHYVLPSRPGDRPADDATGFLGDAAERYQKTGDYYGGFDSDERGAEFMRLHSKPKTFLQNMFEGANLAGENLAAQSPEAREAGKTMARGAEDLASSAVNQLKPGPAAQRIIDAAAKGFSGDAAERGEKYGGPLMGFRPGDEKVNAQAYQWLKDNGLDPSNMGLLQQTARYLTDVGIGSARLGMGGLDLTGRLFGAALHGGGQAVTEDLLRIGVSKATAESVGDTIGQIAEMFALKGENPFHGVAPDARIGQEFDKGIINRSGRLPVDRAYVDPDQPLLKGLLNTPDPAFRAVAEERAARTGQPLEDDLSDQSPRFQRGVTPTPKPPFYSQIDKIVEDKGQAKASPEQWLGLIKNPQSQIKPEELERTGIVDWLEELKAQQAKTGQKVQLTKQQVLDYSKTHGVEIKEVVYGGSDPKLQNEIDSLTQQKHELAAKDRELIYAGKWIDANENLVKVQDIDDRIKEIKEQQKNSPGPRTRFGGGDYVTPGGENYREMLFVFPQKDTSAQVAQLAQVKQNAYGRVLDEIQKAKGPGWTRGDSVNLMQDAQTGNMTTQKLAYLREIMGPDVADRLLGDYHRATEDYNEAVAARQDPYRHSHWPNQDNVLAHVRFDERQGPNGEKILHIAEIQSDIHQAGRDSGYKGTTPEEVEQAFQAYQKADTQFKQEQSRIAAKASGDMYNSKDGILSSDDVDIRRAFHRLEVNDKDYRTAEKAAKAAGDAWRRDKDANYRGVPDAPFRNSSAWSGYVMKRMIRWAAENGFDRVTWDTGETNARRWGQIHHIGHIEYEPTSRGTFKVRAYDMDGSPVRDLSGDYSIGEVADKFGGHYADDMIRSEGYKENENGRYYDEPEEGEEVDPYQDFMEQRTLHDVDQEMGGEGMMHFYDKIVRNNTDKYVGKHGAEVEHTSVPSNEEGWHITPPDDDYGETKWRLESDNGDYDDFESLDDAQAELEVRLGRAPAHGFDITDKLRDYAMQGQPRFQRRPASGTMPLPANTRIERDDWGRVELTFTPDMMIKRVALAQNLRQRLDALGLHDIGLRVADAIYEIGAGGARDEAGGYYLNKLINVALTDDPLGTLDHEAIHAMRALKLFSDKEWAVLEKEAAQVWNAHHDINNLYADLSPAKRNEEGIAFAFSKWAKAKNLPQGSFVEQIMRRVQDFLVATKNAFTGQGFHTPESIFRKIESGEIGQRKLDERGLINTPSGVQFQRGVAPVQPTFYSALTRFVEQGQDKASATQWLGTMANAGIKPAEIEWHDLKNWLNQQKGQITKQQLLDHVRADTVEVHDVFHGELDPKLIAEADGLTKEKYRLGDRFDQLIKEGKRDEAFELNDQFDTINDRLREIENEKRRLAGTKYDAYKLPGGENYHELLLTLPYEKKGLQIREGESAVDALNRAHAETPPPFKSGHFPTPNILAHIRFDERVGPNGERVLHIAEVQSDWHKAGRKYGYTRPNVELVATRPSPNAGHFEVRTADGHFITNVTEADMQTPELAIAEARRRLREAPHLTGNNLVPDAPFKKTWPELAMKRMLRYAAENGYDTISWDTGKTQADRYKLSHHVSHIDVEPGLGETKHIAINGHNGIIGSAIVDGDGKLLQGYDVLRDGVGKNLSEYVGEGLADKILQPGGKQTISGVDLDIGGKGMMNFYDQILPAFMNRYTKKWGGKVEPSNVAVNKEGWKISPPSHNMSNRWLLKSSDYNSRGMTFDTEAEAKAALAGRLQQTPTHAVKITDALREAVMQGQAMFKRRGMINTTVH